MARAVCGLSPVSMTRSRPIPVRVAMAAAAPGLRVSATANRPRTWPPQAATTTLRPVASSSAARAARSGGTGNPSWSSSSDRPMTTSMASTVARTPWPAIASNAVEPGRLDPPVPGGVDDGLAERVFRSPLGAGGQPQQIAVGDPGGGHDVGEGHAADSERSRLVQHHGVDAAGALQHLAAFDQHAEAGAPAGTDHDGDRGGQPESAWAGDDQHRHRGQHSVVRPVQHQGPAGQGAGGGDQHDRHEDAGHPVGQSLDRGF